MLRYLADPSGGIRYHWRAQLAQARWASFRRNLRDFIRPWLMAQRAKRRPVLLIGPSGGYTLPWQDLCSLSKLGAVEPDPVARAILRARCRHIDIDANPALGWNGHAYQAKELRLWFDRYPDHALIFCNLLGQLETSGHKLSQAWHQEFRAHIKARHWLSYHDLASCKVSPDLEYLKAHWRTKQMQHQELDPLLWQRVYAKASGPLHLVDHGTARLFSFARQSIGAHALFEWPLLDSQWHVVEGLASATDSRGRAKTSNPFE